MGVLGGIFEREREGDWGLFLSAVCVSHMMHCQMLSCACCAVL